MAEHGLQASCTLYPTRRSAGPAGVLGSLQPYGPHISDHLLLQAGLQPGRDVKVTPMGAPQIPTMGAPGNTRIALLLHTLITLCDALRSLWYFMRSSP